MQGQYLNYAVAAGQYNVTVGRAQCSVLDLTSLRIECDPPSRQPEPDLTEYFPEGGIPQVMVKRETVQQLSC